jgi:hypothetical protein
VGQDWYRAGTIATLKEEMRGWQGPNMEGDEIEQIYLLSDE